MACLIIALRLSSKEKRLAKKTPNILIIIFILLLFPVFPSLADIFQYTDENGVVHFSNVGVGTSKNFKKIKSEPLKKESSKSEISSSKNTALSGIPHSYSEIINSACYRHGVDPTLVHAIIKVESDFNPYAMSRKGAMGLMQLMPQTALELNVKDTFSPIENIHGGVKYLKYLIDRYQGNLSLALAAYNAGETRVNRLGSIPPIRETQNYVKKILALYNGTGTSFLPRYTIYIGHGEDGGLLLTDNPSNHQNKKFVKKASKDL